jgi:hypothetical protein
MRDSLLLSDLKAVGIRCEGLRMRSRHTSRSVAPIGIFRRKSALLSMYHQERTVRTCGDFPLCQTLGPLELDEFLLCQILGPLELDESPLCQILGPLELDEFLLCRTLRIL